MQDFKKLKVWQNARELCQLCYKSTADFPSTEQFGLTNQIRRCAVSVMANIAEGRGRGTDAEFKRYVQIAIGSVCELESHFLIAFDLKFLKHSDLDKLSASIDNVRKMLISLSEKLKNP